MTAQLCQLYSFTGTATGAATENTTVVRFILPNKVGANNRIVLALYYSTTTAPTITDNNGNSWPASSVTSTSGAIDLTIWDLKNANSGSTTITATFSTTASGAVQPVWGTCVEWSGLSTTLGNGGTHQIANAVGPNISAGAFTPTNNDSNGGNLILAFTCDASGGGDIGPSGFVAGGSFALMEANVVNRTSATANGLPSASEFFVQAAFASITPTMTATADSTSSYNCAAIALPLFSGAGTPPSASGIRIAKLIKQISKNQNSATTVVVQFPTVGNLRVLMANSYVDTQLTSVTDSESNTWTNVSQDHATPAVYYFKNAAANAALTVTLHLTALSVNVDTVLFDIANAATGTVVGATGFSDSGLAGGTGSQQHKPDITPTSSTSLITTAVVNGFGPEFAITSPSGAVLANATLADSTFTASTSTTTMTVTGTPAGDPIQFGQNVEATGATPLTSGTFISALGTGTGGTGTYTINPSQTHGSETMHSFAENDGGTVNAGDAYGYIYNTSTSAQNWTWSLSRDTNSGVAAVAIEWLAPAGAAPTWGFSSRREDERYIRPLRPQDDFSGQTFFRPSQIPVPQRWQPTTGQEDRPPPPRIRPDDSSIEEPQFFLPSPNPVPQRWFPTTGQEDRPPPPRVRPDDSAIEEPQWFVQSPNPVPARWLPTTGQEDRLPEFKKRPDDNAIEEAQFFLPSPNPVPARWLPVSGPIDREKLPPIQRTDWTFPFFRPSQVPVPITWLPTTGEEDRPPNPNRIRAPDEPFPWFVRSPVPVPITWLPQLDGWERPKRVNLDPSGTAIVLRQLVVPISGIAWYMPSEDRERLPPIPRSPDEATPFFVRSPSPVPTTWLPQWDGWERPKRIDLDPSLTAFSFKAPAVVNTIAGMAWFNPPETWPPPFRPDAYATETRPPFIEAPLQVFMAQTNADDFSPLKAFKFEEQTRGFVPQQTATPVGISGIAWWRPSDDARLVPGWGTRRPDDFTPWFVRSPVPVPSIWLPLTGADRERLPSIGRPPDEPGTYYRSRSSFLPIWLPQWESGEHVKPIWYEDRPTTLAFRAPAAPVGISGISWWRQTEVYLGPPPPQLDYRLGVTLKPPPPPVGISGMAWFMPTQMLSLINPVPQIGPPIGPYLLPAIVTVTGPNLPLFYPPIPPFPGGLWKGRGVQK